MLCLGFIGMDHVSSEPCYKGTILQRILTAGKACLIPKTLDMPCFTLNSLLLICCLDDKLTYHNCTPARQQ